ncbi:MAG: hypothetical protein JXQ76_00815 [Campylobacterales bacterium]|nr:hypothetical protein [Campylobacterales bacterium]
MKILFDKVGSNAKEFEYQKDAIILKGSLSKKSHHEVHLEANLSGDITLDCIRCGVSYLHRLDNGLDLILSDKVVETQDNLDIIEFLDGVINIEDIVDSEINSLESEYNYCSACTNSQEENFEVEF